jgi:AAA+ ATPase superfamily predicted ATPase
MAICSNHCCVSSVTANRHAFIGREIELAQLRRTARLPKAGLVVCRGRRRIGKSTLIERFAEEFQHFYEFQGLAPREEIGNHHQLENFSRQLAEQHHLPALQLQNWHEAFALLARLTEGQKALIFLDEISWMASRDKDFVGQLKIAWDTRFKKNRRLILVLCGSVSSWIDKNILNSADFLGRVSLSLDLRELPLDKCNDFFSEVGGVAGRRMSTLERSRVLCVTGGVPRYLEEVEYGATAERNIIDLCFTRGGLLVDEFDKIFNDIFSARAPTYRQIAGTLTDGALTFSEICSDLGVAPSGVFSEYLEDLVAAGFVHRDYVYSLTTGRRGKLSRYRLKDNYLRFYLKYIEPQREKIAAGIFDSERVRSFAAFDAIMGLQFQNLVLNNIPLVLEALKINLSHIRSASPYFQNATGRQKACQVDLLIDTKYAVYLCEIKFRTKLGSSILDEVAERASRLKVDRSKSLRRVLIYLGDLAHNIEASGAFDQLIAFEQFLQPLSR